MSAIQKEDEDGVLMQLRTRLKFTSPKRLSLVLQEEAAECGAACLAMIAAYHGNATDLRTLRRAHPISRKGATLHHLIKIAESLGLQSRPIRVDLESLRELRGPSVLHWSFSHFVVLARVERRGLRIHDPAVGVRLVSFAEASENFTGVALELWPSADFKKRAELPRVSVRQLMGAVRGLPRSLTQLLLVALSLELFVVIQPLFINWVVDNAIVSADRSLLTTLAFGFLIVTCVSILIRAGRSWLGMLFSTELGLQWRANVFAHLMRLPVQFFEKRSMGDVISRFQGVNAIQSAVTTSLVDGVLDGLMVCVTMTALLIYSPLLALIVALAAVLSAIAMVVSSRARLIAGNAQVLQASVHSTHFMESVRGIKAIKLFQREPQRRASWLAYVVEEVNAGLKLQRIHILFEAIRGALYAVENIVLIWVGALMVIDQKFTVGALMAVYSYKTQFEGRFSGLVDKLMQLRLLRIPAERLADIVLTEPERQSSGGERSLIEEPAGTAICVRNLSFRYSEDEPYVLKDVSFDIAAREHVAIVGASGAGKTTLINVLTGILPATSGEILIGGQSAHEDAFCEFRSILATVLQEDTLFAGSLAENISFFDADPEQAWIEQCAQAAAIHDEIVSMPLRYMTQIGDLGATLSGGQRQRILLARALYKKPSVLVLDEATSNLDVQRERQIVSAIRKLPLTRIVVSHRPETIASADRVLMLVNGTIRELAPNMSAEFFNRAAAAGNES